MDRAYRAPDLVHVHEQGPESTLVTTFSQVGRSIAGMDYYLHKDRLYYGYERVSDGYVYIRLDKPVPVHGGIYVM